MHQPYPRANYRDINPAMGDAVRLRTGGVAMLVVDVLSNGKMVCAYVPRDLGLIKKPRRPCEVEIYPHMLHVIQKARR